VALVLSWRVPKRHPVLPEPDLTPHQVVAEEKTRWFAPFSRGYLAVTVFLLVVMVLGHGGIVYGSVGYRFLFLAESRHYSAGFVFALAAWAAAASAAVYLLNALFGQRIERKYTQLAGALMFAGGWWGVYAVAAPRGWILLITIPGALLPACMVAIFGKRQRRRTLEELAR